MDKELLVNAICGKGFFGHRDAIHFENQKVARFCGNQHNEDWCWLSDQLNLLSMWKLTEIYYRSEDHNIQINPDELFDDSIKEDEPKGLAYAIMYKYGK
jgi:hypothetical protein